MRSATRRANLVCPASSSFDRIAMLLPITTSAIIFIAIMTICLISNSARASVLTHARLAVYYRSPPSTAAPRHLDMETIREIVLAIATASAAVGGIVVVFIAFTFDRVLRLRGDKQPPAAEYRALREKTRLQMLMVVAGISMTFLLLAPVYLFFALLADDASLKVVGTIGLGLFCYSVTAILVALFSYTYLEKPFTYLNEPRLGI